MGEVVYLRPEDEHKKEPPCNVNGYYFCTVCSRDFFRLFEDGSVSCYTCGRKINNLFVKLDARDQT